MTSSTKKIINDPRHYQIEFIVNKQAEKRFFESSTLRLITTKGRDEELLNYLSSYEADLAAYSTTAQKIPHHFHYLPTTTPTSDSSELLAGKHLRNYQYKLSGWPDFDEVQPTLDMFELCVAILKEYIPYDRLVSAYFSDAPERLDQLLLQLKELGILKQQESS